MRKIQKTNSEGFTIIEVLIVLAIAGLIIAIVLFAVPALQRNGSNTAIKNDASAVVSGIAESRSNNDGSTPTAVNGTGNVTIANTTNTTAKVQGSTQVTTVTAAPATNAPAIGRIQVFLGHKCTVSGTYTPGTAGDVSTRSVAVYYSVETSSQTVQKCIEG